MRKSQAAMEFLLTYGWAMLVVIVGISSMAHFGVLDPYRYVPKFISLNEEELLNYEKKSQSILKIYEKAITDIESELKDSDDHA